MVELLLFPQIRDLANLPSVKLTFKEADELSPVQASEHAFSRSTESLWLALEKERIIKSSNLLVTEQTFHSLLPQH
jgi:hypothetical protein